jgi:serine/threonine protein kinase
MPSRSSAFHLEARVRDVVHRDLKGANLFVERGRTVKILDFGIAKLFDPSRRVVRTEAHQIIGTPGYMPPEQVRGRHVGPDTATGDGNMNEDPAFVDPENRDFHLQPTSPVRDAADPTANLKRDIDGDTRPAGGRSDMGADEVPAR